MASHDCYRCILAVIPQQSLLERWLASRREDKGNLDGRLGFNEDASDQLIPCTSSVTCRAVQFKKPCWSPLLHVLTIYNTGHRKRPLRA